jgi:hypothetical protein
MKVGYSKTFPIYGKEEWEKCWLEEDISIPKDLLNISDEDIAQYMLQVRRIQYALKKQVESFHYESNKADEKKKEVEAVIQKEETKPDSIIDSINSCNELKVLESYKFIIKGKPELETAYNNRIKQLTT